MSLASIKTATSRVVLAVALLTPAIASACPNCKDGLANHVGGDARSASRGFSWSVIFMIAVPLGLAATAVSVVSNAARRGLLPEM